VTEPPSLALFIGSYHSLILGSFAGCSQRPSTNELRRPIFEHWREYQRRCVFARSWLTEERHDDLLLVLIGPPGSDQSSEWVELMSQMERNELVCRKFVWLPSADETKWPESIARFALRTFLSQPWIMPAQGASHALDMLSDSEGVLDSSWKTILDAAPADKADVDYNDLVRELIDTSPKTPAP
jgi:hypothetical protein